MVTGSRCFVIAEAGINHNGSEELALRLVEAAAATGADAVKFQTFSADKLCRPGTEKAAYQKCSSSGEDQHSMLRGLELPRAAYEQLYARADELGIEFMSTPFDEESADMLLDLGMRRLKIPSGELTNLPFLHYIGGKNVPVILSTGMATLEEVREAVDALRAARSQHNSWREGDLTLLHCTSSYPAPLEDVNLRAMQTLHRTFGLPVGYSDHTAGTRVAVAAVAAGAAVIEKHMTLDHDLPGPDHRASLDVEEFAEMVREIRTVEVILGSDEKKPSDGELPIRDLMRRSVVLRRSLSAGDQIAETDVVLLRPGYGIPPKDLFNLIGCRVAYDLPAGHVLAWSDVFP